MFSTIETKCKVCGKVLIKYIPAENSTEVTENYFYHVQTKTHICEKCYQDSIADIICRHLKIHSL